MSLTQLIQLANRFYDLGQNDDVDLVHKLIKSQINTALPSDYKKAEKQSPTIILVRHGATTYNAGQDSIERLRGWLDLPLNDKGYLQAEKVAQLLTLVPIKRIVASDLNRTRDTAKAIQRMTNVDLKLSPSLRPWHQGINTGEPVQKYVPIMLEYIKDKPDEKIEGSPESFNTFKARVLSKFQELMAEAIDSPDKGAVCMVAHSRNCRLLEAWINSGCKDINTIDLTPMLRKEDNCDPGGFLAAQHDGQNWKLIDLIDQSVLKDDKGERSK